MKFTLVTLGLASILITAHAAQAEGEFSSELEVTLATSFCASPALTTQKSDSAVADELLTYRLKEMLDQRPLKQALAGCVSPGCAGSSGFNAEIASLTTQKADSDKVLSNIDDLVAGKPLDPKFPDLLKKYLWLIWQYSNVTTWLSAPDFTHLPAEFTDPGFRQIFSTQSDNSSLVIKALQATMKDYPAKVQAIQEFLDQHQLSDSPDVNRKNLALYEQRNTNIIPATNLHALPGGYQDCGMDPAEIAAIELYSQTTYIELNRSVREQGIRLASYAPFVRVLKSALAHLHPYEGVVGRGLQLDASKAARYATVGSIVSESEFLSTSVGSSPFGGTFTMKIHSKSGRFIAPFSAYYTEHEVLFPPGCQFRVTNSSAHSVELEEVSCPLP